MKNSLILESGISIIHEFFNKWHRVRFESIIFNSRINSFSVRWACIITSISLPQLQMNRTNVEKLQVGITLAGFPLDACLLSTRLIYRGSERRESSIEHDKGENLVQFRVTLKIFFFPFCRKFSARIRRANYTRPLLLISRYSNRATASGTLLSC